MVSKNGKVAVAEWQTNCTRFQFVHNIREIRHNEPKRNLFLVWVEAGCVCVGGVEAMNSPRGSYDHLIIIYCMKKDALSITN